MTPLPGAPFLHRRANELWLEDVRLAELAAAHGTPLYVYSRGAMRAALAPYQKALAGRRHLICYAMKANSNLAVLQTFAAAGCGFDIVSGGELRRVLAIGGDPSRVVFSGVGKAPDELRFALASGVRCFNVESESELHALSGVAMSAGRRARISLRVNPDVDARTHPYISTGLRGNKFGIAHERAVALYRQAAHLPGIEVAGIDCHIGSQITEGAPYLAALDRLLDLVEAVEREGIALAHIDLGGGLGITYRDETPPAADELIAAMLARIDARGHGHREILIEPGRSLVGNAGVLLTRVLVLKRGSERNFCIVDAAMNDLVRPAMYDAWMGIAPCTLREDQPEVWDVVGPICESGDWLGRERSLALSEGDLLAVTSAGAYAMAMASNYNSRPRAAEVLVDGAAAHIVRLRESVEALYADERLVR
ncbi:MAG TPA: diaminopimelate decarboxylase [Burkholderiaceae bacterium]|nr:diaminopimelate decarboxylase [Burkholderiaceae bacterium]